MPPEPISLNGYSTRELLQPPADPAAEPEADFPLSWYEEFLQEVVRRQIVVLTFDDLFRDSDDWDYRSNYKREFQNWMKHVRDPRKRYLVIQHDVDNHPFFTERMIALEAQYGIRSNVFIFNHRWTLRNGPGKYDVNHDFLQEAERQGFVIGYHQNAFQLSGFDFDKAAEIYRQDVRELRKRYRINYVVPHGGRGGGQGPKPSYNHDVPMPAEFRSNLRWVFNRYCVRMHRNWSDGGVRRSRDAKRLAGMDLITSFLNEIRPGERAFCLMHPQRWGFNVQPQNNPLLAAQPWYRQVCQRHHIPLGDAA